MVFGWCFYKLYGLFLGCLFIVKFCKNFIVKISVIIFIYVNIFIIYVYEYEGVLVFFDIKLLIKR